MFGALVSGSTDPGSSPGRGHCVGFLGETLYSHSAGERNAGGNPAMDLHPIPWEVVILLVASCYGNRVSSGLKGHWARMQTLPFFQVVY